MELFILLYLVFLFFCGWGVVRILGWMFNGPRHRRRQMIRYLQYDAYQTARMMEEMRRRRGHRY